MARYVYSPHYRVDIGLHVFPTAKYDLIRKRLLTDGDADAQAFIEPEPASEEDVTLVHDREYFRRCRDGHLTVEEIWQLELPWSAELFDASIRCVGGTIIAARLAMSHGVGLHVGGGFHHAFSDHGEGFCVFNDPACAVRRLQRDGLIERALIIDCDLHHGNGTAAIFAGDPAVATFSMHQQNIYPAVKPPSTIDVGLPPGVDDDTYLALLVEHSGTLLREQDPELVVYVAGADPYRHDQLGTLGLTLDGLGRRDAVVVEACRERRLPLVVVLAGGYAHRVEDTVAIHLTTLRTAATLWREAAPATP